MQQKQIFGIVSQRLVVIVQEVEVVKGETGKVVMFSHPNFTFIDVHEDVHIYYEHDFIFYVEKGAKYKFPYDQPFFIDKAPFIEKLMSYLNTLDKLEEGVNS